MLTFSIWGFEMSFDFIVLLCFGLEVTIDPLEDEEGLAACLGLCLFGIGLIWKVCEIYCSRLCLTDLFLD